jgi:hypothetical protein
MRVAAVAAAALALAAPAAASPGEAAFLHDGRLVVVDLATHARRVALGRAQGPVRWSGDGRLLSAGGQIVDGPLLPAAQLSWAPAGETAAFVARDGSVELWTPGGGSRTIVPAAWGARSLAWGGGGRLTVTRAVCRPSCGIPRHQEVWLWRAGRLRLVAGPILGRTVLPFAAGVAPDGRALWWADPEGSASLAADGLVLSAGRTPLATTLPFPEFVVRCGGRLALVAGRDRYTTHGKRILLGGRDLSRDRSRSWISPSCSADGTRVVAAAGRDHEGRLGREHRAIWQLLPARRQLTAPPRGATDEAPHVLGDGSVLFVRTRETSRPLGNGYRTTEHGTLERLDRGTLSRVADVTFTATDGDPSAPLNYYGHYPWPWLLAVAPG